MMTDKELIESAVQAAIDAGLAVNGENGIASARHAARHILTELLSLRTSSGGVTSGEVDPDSIRLLKQFADMYRSGAQGASMDFDAAQALSLSIEDVLSSLHAQPEEACPSCGGSGRYGDAAARAIDGKIPDQPQGTGSREAVAWRADHPVDGDYTRKFTGQSRVADLWAEDGLNVERLVPLSQLQAVERERDELAKVIDPNDNRPALMARIIMSSIKRLVRAETAEASLAAAREALTNIRELNLAGEDENGHRWANSDLIEQEIHAALAGSNG